ncbi:hypothetical protein ACOMHN_018019 [Nucella lapillus]
MLVPRIFFLHVAQFTRQLYYDTPSKSHLTRRSLIICQIQYLSKCHSCCPCHNAKEYGFPVSMHCTLASKAVDRVMDRWYSDHHQACPLYVMLKELVARVPPVSGIIRTQTDLW